MNAKSLLPLVLLLAVLVLGLYVVRRPVEAPEAPPPPPPRSSPIARDVIEDKPGPVVRIVAQRSGEPEWVFEKGAGAGEGSRWRMTAPMEMPVVAWEIDRVPRQLTTLEYEISYVPDQPGALTAAQAGLEPPEAVVTLADEDGQSVTVEIGRPASESETYVRVKGRDDIYVGKASFKELLKKKPLEYREREVWNFDPNMATRVEIIDRTDIAEPAHFAFVRDGRRWMMESPVSARATSRVDDALTAIARLRASEWVEDAPGRLAGYGLDPAFLTVRVTVEHVEQVEEPPVSPADDGGPMPEPEKRLVVHELHVSWRTPIGDENKAFIRSGDETAVGTMMRTTIDKLRPYVEQWRDMRLTHANVRAATRVELITTDGAITLTRDGGRWHVEPDGGLLLERTFADDDAVLELLEAVDKLEAVAFVDGDDEEIGRAGMDAPRVDLRLTLPGEEGMERFRLGDYTEQVTRRMVYVQRHDGPSVAKVRASAVEPLWQPPLTYLDRTIINVPPDDVERLTLKVERPGGEGLLERTFARVHHAWSLVEPVTADVRQDDLENLVVDLSTLRGTRVVSLSGEASAYGLHAPTAAIEITWSTMADDDHAHHDCDHDHDHDHDHDAAGVPVTHAQRVLFSAHDGSYYAMPAESNVIYEVSSRVLEQLMAEYRPDTIWSFEVEDVTRFAVRQADQEIALIKQEDRWVFEPEPDLPLHQSRVLDALLRIRDLRTSRFVAEVLVAREAYGLDAPTHEVSLQFKDGTEWRLSVSSRGPDRGADSERFAVRTGLSGVFLLTGETIGRFALTLDEIEE